MFIIGEANGLEIVAILNDQFLANRKLPLYDINMDTRESVRIIVQCDWSEAFRYKLILLV